MVQPLVRCAVADAGPMGLMRIVSTNDPEALVMREVDCNAVTWLYFQSFPGVVALCGVDIPDTGQVINHTIERCGNNTWGDLPLGFVCLVGALDTDTGHYTDLPDSFINEMPLEDPK